MFEKGSNESKNFIKYFGSKKALLAAGNSMTRSNFKKVANAAGVANDKVFMANSYSEALEVMNKQKPEVIIAEYQLGSNTSLELLGQHLKLFPNRLNSIFALISEKNSLALSCLAADAGVDAYITKPYTYDKLEKEFAKSVMDKVTPTHYLTKIEEAKIQLDNGNYEESLKILTAAKTLDPNPCLALYYEATIKYNQKDFTRAIELLKESIFHIPDHYKSLNLLLEIYINNNMNKEALEIIETLLKKYPPNPEKIPLYLKTFIRGEKYDSIIKFCDDFANYEEDNPHFKNYISAGLAITGKYFVTKKDKEHALSSLKKSQEYCNNNPNILASIANSYIQIDEPNEADKVLQKLTEAGNSNPQFLVLDLEIRNKILPPTETFKMGMDLLKKGIKDPKVYEILIQNSIILKRDEAKTRELVEEGSATHPTKKNEFEKIFIDATKK
ncbi:MAG: hypothetical protein U0T83_03925 [Bacteriovoracaceae bacterium]